MCDFKIDNLNSVCHVIIILITQNTQIYKQPLNGLLNNDFKNKKHE